MTGPISNGNRRIDRVLSEDYLAGLTDLPLDEVRTLRKEAEQEETDLSYVRRLLQGRADILKAELERRASGSSHDGDIVASLVKILTDDGPVASSPPYGLGRHSAVEPSRADAHRRRVELLIADVDLSDPGKHDEASLHAALERLQAEEREISEHRKQVQKVMDACTAEIGRRYRDGGADVSDLLPTSS